MQNTKKTSFIKFLAHLAKVFEKNSVTTITKNLKILILLLKFQNCWGIWKLRSVAINGGELYFKRKKTTFKSGHI
jgi:hypothetical protein